MNLLKTLNAKSPRLLQLLLLISTLAVSLSSLASDLVASVDRSTINPEETLELTLRYNGQAGFGGPDFSLLEENFDVLSNNRSNQFRSFNGQAESWTQWTLMLAPKKSGKLLIPSFSYNNNFSDAIEITVVKAKAKPGSAGPLKDIFIESELSKTQSTVQEQILYKVRLFTSVNLSGINSEELTLDGALSVQLAEHRYQRRIQGRPYGVVEVIYAIYPQNSGELVIPSLTHDLTLSSRSRDPWSDPFGSQRGAIKRLRTKEQRLQIQSKPDNYTGQNWLPAENIQLEQDWSANPDEFTVGEPITRILTLTAKGLTAAQLPPLTMAPVDGIKFYPDQPQTQDQKADSGVTGIRTETVAIVPTKSGELTLPPIAVTWWDTDSKQQRQATLPATTIQVAPSAAAPIAQPIPDIEIKQPTSVATEPASAESSTPWLWIVLTCAFALLSGFLGLEIYRLKRRPGRRDIEQASAENVDEKEAYKALVRTCAGDNLTAIRQAYLDWARVHWPSENILSIEASLSQIRDDDLKRCLKDLDRALYSDRENTPWSGEQLRQCLEQYRRNTNDPVNEAPSLRPLYPEQA